MKKFKPAPSLSKRIVQKANKADWDGVATLLEQLLSDHIDKTRIATYEQLVAGGKWMLDSGHNDLCLRLCQAALTSEPKRFEAPEVMFFLFLNLHEHDGARDALTLVRNSGPNKATYDSWQVLLYNEEGNHDSICDLYDAGKINLDRKDPRISELIFSVVLALLAHNRLSEARSLVDEFYPNPSENNPNIVNLHAKMNQAEENFAEAIKYFELAEEKFEGTQVAVESRWNKALMELSIGHLESGWKNYECRWEWERFTTKKLHFPCEWWRGQPLADKSIIIWGEQGIGDEILFLTLLPEISKLKPSKIGIFASGKIVPIIEKWYPQATVYPFTTHHINVVLPSLDYDYHVPCGSLPLYLNRLDVASEKQYLPITTDVKNLKSRILTQFPGKKRIVGLSWRSGSLTHRRVQYYLSYRAVIDIIHEAPSDVLFVSLQYGLTEEELNQLSGRSNFHIPDADFFNDVASQGDYIQSCDLVVTSASVCLALAGICGTPCITWGPKRNWTMLGSVKYPWFPLVHLIRCDVNWDLGSLVLQIKKTLQIFYRS